MMAAVDLVREQQQGDLAACTVQAESTAPGAGAADAVPLAAGAVARGAPLAAAAEAPARGPGPSGRGAKRPAGEPRPPPPPRPTHFLAVQTASPQSTACIHSIQSTLSQSGPDFADCCVDAAGAHVTLLVMDLSGEGRLAAAGEALQGLGARLAHDGLLGPLQLQLLGLGHFRRQVHGGHARTRARVLAAGRDANRASQPLSAQRLALRPRSR
ncbi:hypothetical protein MNEG_16195 [Monoraphidium neglectum]|uniref:A-kinase anchor protein 7-like phosphoesterase domain-containing protein n=1 Tax=Monoraphidium neglectum TaxID=145388 RepID=A0A0D2K6F8_9CHLO|nr:hypothetical protein MNEG_16195 [Monoraphidium neglectum]KIY91768.1 hypothetical protein MNEG_16195 [Monoraphidium neglectum]|eukprot:XP_013890788.1 hypothetical protein MNEG_16195 [Monoraphidium neglectum]